MKPRVRIKYFDEWTIRVKFFNERVALNTVIKSFLHLTLYSVFIGSDATILYYKRPEILMDKQGSELK